jgi:cytochrome c oxidase assembly protein subunit 15
MDFQHGFDITQQVGPNYLGGQLTASGRVAIHVTHRLGAMVVLGYFVILLSLMWRRREASGLAVPIGLVAAALSIQIMLGLSNIIFQVPIAVAVAHNAMGAGLLLTVIHLVWQYHQRSLSHSTVISNTKIINREITV